MSATKIEQPADALAIAARNVEWYKQARASAHPCAVELLDVFVHEYVFDGMEGHERVYRCRRCGVEEVV